MSVWGGHSCPPCMHQQDMGIKMSFVIPNRATSPVRNLLFCNQR